MEMRAEWFGSDEGAFFDFSSISKNRKIKYPWLPDAISSKIAGNTFTKIPIKQNGEMRILSVDIALMSSKKHNNDATAIFVNQLVRTKAGRYTSNIVYATTFEGMHTEDQALLIRKMFDEFGCDYLVIDAQGVGAGVVDCLLRDITDRDSGEIYPAISVVNNPDMAARCTSIGAPKVIWAIKASAQFNSECAFLLREGFRSGRIRLLETEYDAEPVLNELKGYKSLNPQERIQFQLPYIQTTLLIDELTKLRHEEANGKVRIYERSGMRKDRYSSLAYNYYVAIQLENKLNKKHSMSINTENMFVIKPPSTYSGKAVRNGNGRNNKQTWY